jgi:hypothetical protein
MIINGLVISERAPKSGGKPNRYQRSGFFWKLSWRGERELRSFARQFVDDL